LDTPYSATILANYRHTCCEEERRATISRIVHGNTMYEIKENKYENLGQKTTLTHRTKKKNNKWKTKRL
jgi:hypothetical protein